MTDDTSTNTGKADVDDTYNTAYVYWLVETATGTAHTWANTDYYYRVLLYSSELGGTIKVENATGAQTFTANETVYLNVENTCGSGAHEYLLSTIYMNKWAGYYDEFGVDTEDYSPLSGVTFSFSLKNSAGTTVPLTSNTTDGDTAVQYGETDTDGKTQSNNDAGQMSVIFKFPLLLNEWIVAVATASGMSVTTITDITSDSTKLATFNAITGDIWDKYADMLYVASAIDASSTSQLTDLAANDGAVAKRILTAYAATYSTTEISVDESGNVTENGDSFYISAMENVLGSYYTWEDSEGNTQSLGYKSYYAHIVLTETKTTTSSEYGDYELNTTDYALYLQFRPTGTEGSANIKYFYLDDVDRTDYYYDEDPSGVSTKVLDESFDNTTREQIVNMPVLKKSVSITKYGYTLNSSTTGKTDDELNGYFDGMDGSGRKKITASFYLQRYDSTSGSWKYYSADDSEYVDDADKASSIIEATTSGWSGKLAIGWYRLIEISAGSGYDVVLDGTSVGVKDSSDTTEAVRYFWVKTESDSSAVNVYDPDSIDLLIHKYSLSGTETKSGVTITLTDSDGIKYPATSWNSTAKAYVIENLPAGTYTVTETVTNMSVTDAYFQSFTITVGYDREAKTETVDLTYSKTKSVTQYATYITGVSASISGQVDCTNDSTEDSITANPIDSSGATATLKIYNPSTGSIMITKTDANDSSSTLSGATFELYWQKFDVETSDAYVAKASDSDAPTYTSGSSDWTYVGAYTTSSGGTVTASGLTPGWYTVVETSAPSGYELNSEVQVVAVVADMAVENGVHTMTDNGKVSVTVADVKKVNLSVTKIFNPNDFKQDLQDEARYYSVTFGLYVYDTTSKTYISAYNLGLTETDTVTVKVTDTSSGTSTFTTGTGTWYNLIQMEEYLDSNGHYVLGTYTLDGSYYICEISVKNTNTSADVTSKWWVSGISISSGSGLSVADTAVTDSSGNSYYKISGFEDNATGTVTVTNDLTYATVTILKTNDASPAEPLSGATFTVYSDASCTDEYAVATGTTGMNGTCTITVPVSSRTGTTFYIKETTAPTSYTLYEDTITVTLTSGQKVSYSQDGNGYLKIADSNGVYVKLTKYDNIYGYSSLSPLSNVTFTLLRSEDYGATWTVLRTYTTDSDGEINFDTLKNSEGVIYMLAETNYDTDAYDGLESVWYTVTSSGGDTSAETELEESTVTVTVSSTEVSYTGYQFSLQGIASDSTYQIYAYNQPRPEVTFIKTGHDDSGSATAIPTAKLQIYSVDASTYTAGQTLTSDEVTAAINAGTSVGTIYTSVVDGKDYSSYVTNLSAGTYLVVETETSDVNDEYVIDKDDSNEVWYQIIVVPSDGTKTMEVNFVNVTQEYSVSIEKTGTTDLDDALLTAEDTQKLTYYLDVDVTNSGPINGLTVTDSGLVATEVYQSVGSDDTDDVTDATAAAAYLKGYYSITSVKIPVDASYVYNSLVFTSVDKTAFSQTITAKVTFTYEDGTTEEQKAVLANVSTTDGYWTATPTYSSLKVVSFTVTWYDENLETYTGYELGSDFAISDSGLNIVVAMEIDGQENGNTSYEAVAEIKNSAAVTYDYTNWDTTGTATTSREEDDAEALTTVPNVSAPVMTIKKSVENETSTSRNSNGTAIIGDTLLYTITLTNSSSSLPMENPIILDLLPQGVVAASAAENSFIANVTIESITDASGNVGKSTLTITGVWRTTSDGYMLLEIETSGSIEPWETVTITLEAVVDSTILNYLTSNASLTNNVFMTSSKKGEVYDDNPDGSVFMGNIGSWAQNYDEDSATGKVLASMLSADFAGYGYISATAVNTYNVTSSVNLLKEVQGDQDETDGDWYHGDEGGTATANIDKDSTDDDGYANFRLTVTNMTEGQNLTNIVLMDIVPKEDGASFNSNIDKEWSLIFDSITSVTITESGKEPEEVDASNYTLWYYTGNVKTSDDVTSMQTAFKSDEKTGWVKASEYTGEMSAITAFAVAFDSTVSLSTGSKLQLIYKAMVPQMSESDASGKAHLATYNDFNLTGDLVESSDSTNKISNVDLYSNYVYVLLSTEPVGVGGMFWIDADGDGVQDSEDVVNPSSYDYSTNADGMEESTASTYNSRTNNYSSYSVVQSLLDTASIQLLTYSGSTSAAKTAYSGSLLTSASWCFLFTDLSSANISSAYTSADAYDSSGILWRALAGASTATWYQLQAMIEGSGSIKYSLTETSSNVQSYDPTVMYGADNSLVGNALTDSSYSASGSTTTTSGTTTGSAITTGSTTATSENFFLYGTTSGNALWNLAEDIGLVIYRDLKITKKDTGSGTPKSGSTFKVYGPYAKGEAANVTSLDSEHLVGTYTMDGENTTTITIENLLYFQEYIIVEVSADDSYDLASAAATGTNISTITKGVTLGSTTYKSAWILGIPTNDSSYASGGENYTTTDPTAYNTVTTDNMTVTNALKIQSFSFYKISGDSYSIGEGSTVSYTPLGGAKFSLYSADDVDVTKTTATDGTETVIDVKVKDTVTPIATATSEDTTGLVKFTGLSLSSGTYYLIETAAPSGYVLLTDYWIVTVDTAANTITLSGGGKTYGSSTLGWYIPNYQTSDLPLTGGIGTWPFKIVGALLMISSAVLYFLRRRRRRA
ncbi:MAG: LPXTG cell wall anchor domain-containing protein [Lachnospiraceae bacterium]|nr:LPXTG cell wall anchor domain-containing protein [Lachnospiraceae bacterium]